MSNNKQSFHSHFNEQSYKSYSSINIFKKKINFENPNKYVYIEILIVKCSKPKKSNTEKRQTKISNAIIQYTNKTIFSMELKKKIL